MVKSVTALKPRRNKKANVTEMSTLSTIAIDDITGISATTRAELTPVATALITFSDVAKHATPNDCWVVLGNGVYDLTRFAKEHPGGAELVTNLAGSDGTAAFLDAHPPTIIKSTLSVEEYVFACKGQIDPASKIAASEKEQDKRSMPAAKIVVDNSNGANNNIWGGCFQLVQLLKAILWSVLKGALAPTAAATIARSAMLLLRLVLIKSGFYYQVFCWSCNISIFF